MPEVKKVGVNLVATFQQAKVKNLVIDVDGVLTDGKFTYSDQGKFTKTFGSHDSDALKIVSTKANIFFISADRRGFPISESRIKDMNFELQHFDATDRINFIRNLKLTASTAFIGDSFTDVPALREADLSLVPKGAHPLAKAHADIVLSLNGGDGAVSEACILLFPELFEWAM